MMLASYYGGICLGPVNTAAGHALAYPLGTKLKLAARAGQCPNFSSCSWL